MDLYVITLSNDEEQERELESNLWSQATRVPIYALHHAQSMTRGYNLAESLLPAPKKADILCFIHQDVRLHFAFDRVIPLYFEYLGLAEFLRYGEATMSGIDKRPIGVVGFAGTQRMTFDGRWWASGPLYGSLVQGELPSDSHPNLRFHKPLSATFVAGASRELWYQPVEAVDGYCMFIRREIFRAVGGFDERYDGWHFYDLDLCLTAIKAGYQNYVIDQPSQHFSLGTYGEPWEAQRVKFQDKWRSWFLARSGPG